MSETSATAPANKAEEASKRWFSPYANLLAIAVVYLSSWDVQQRFDSAVLSTGYLLLMLGGLSGVIAMCVGFRDKRTKLGEKFDIGSRLMLRLLVVYGVIAGLTFAFGGDDKEANEAGCYAAIAFIVVIGGLALIVSTVQMFKPNAFKPSDSKKTGDKPEGDN